MMSKIYLKIPESQQNLTKYDKNILYVFSSFQKYCSEIYASRAIIAAQAGCCEKTVTRSTNRLFTLGYIYKKTIRVGIKTYCIYKVREKYKNLISKAKKISCKFKDAGEKFAVGILRSIPAKIKNVPLVNYINYINSFISSFKETLYVENSNFLPDSNLHEHKKSSSDKFMPIGKILGKFSMQNMDNVVTTEKINEIDQLLGLTLHGKIKLRALDDRALQRGLNAVMMSSDKVINKFELLFETAVAYSLEHRIPVNWKRYYNLRDSYKIGSEDRKFLVEEEKKTIKGEKVSYSNKERVNQRAYSPERERYGEISNKKLSEYKEQQARADHNFVEDIKEQVRMGRLDEKTARERIESRLARTIS